MWVTSILLAGALALGQHNIPFSPQPVGGCGGADLTALGSFIEGWDLDEASGTRTGYNSTAPRLPVARMRSAVFRK